jgi:large subunit ribosomal protein L3
MTVGIVGRKLGMSRIFMEDGESIPVTVVQATPNRVTQKKSLDVDGYAAVQVAVGNRRPSRVTRPMAGHYSKAGVEAGASLWEFRVNTDSEVAGLELGAEITVSSFQAGQKVQVTGITQGKGFQGTIKRHNFGMGDATHGNSLSHRAPGSIGQRQTPGRVFKGKRMSGHMGASQITTRNLQVVKVDSERQLLLIKGAIPGSKGRDVVVRPMNLA